MNRVPASAICPSGQLICVASHNTWEEVAVWWAWQKHWSTPWWGVHRTSACHSTGCSAKKTEQVNISPSKISRTEKGCSTATYLSSCLYTVQLEPRLSLACRECLHIPSDSNYMWVTAFSGTCALHHAGTTEQAQGNFLLRSKEKHNWLRKCTNLAPFQCSGLHLRSFAVSKQINSKAIF